MTIQEFTQRFLSALEEEIQRDETMQAISRIGNGEGGTYLVLSREGKKDFQVGVIEHYYEVVRTEESLEKLVGEILGVFRSDLDIKILSGNRNDFSSISNRIIYGLIHYGKNLNELRDKAYIKWQEFAITFYIVEIDGPDSVYSMPVTKEDLENWHISEEGLYQIAAQNTPAILPLQVCSLRERVKEESAWLPDSEKIPWENMPEILILSNCMQLYGASAILYEGTLREVARAFGHDFYLVPVSVNEVFVLSSQGVDPDGLREWHRESLEFVQNDEGWLSDEIYLYRAEYQDVVWIPENRLLS